MKSKLEIVQTILEFRDGLIYRQRNYDCFEPFS